jgi:hypothetical protein
MASVLVTCILVSVLNTTTANANTQITQSQAAVAAPVSQLAEGVPVRTPLLQKAEGIPVRTPLLQVDETMRVAQLA